MIGLVAACSDQPSSTPVNEATFVAQGACAERQFEGTTFTTCPLDTAEDELRLAWRGADGLPLRSFDALERNLGADRGRLRYAMNAGMFDEQGGPVGLFVENGKELKKLNLNAGPGNFHMMPNGVFAMDRDGQLSVTPSASFRDKVRHPIWATQSGPMLLIDGKLHPRFEQDGPSRLVRNAVGVSGPHKAFFVISEEGVSFGRLARFFRDELSCRDALFLDGSVSALWDPVAGRKDGAPPLGPFVVVLRRASASPEHGQAQRGAINSR